MVKGRNGSQAERGSALVITTLLALSSLALTATFLVTSLGKVSHVEQEIADHAAFNAAESGLNAMTERVWNTYRNTSPVTRFDEIDRIDGKYDADEQLKMVNVTMGRSRFTAEVTRVERNGDSYADVEIAVEGMNRKSTSYLTMVVRYDLEMSRIFNYAYFINNFGWLWGSGITVNGDVRSNGNFSLKNATVNGDIFAAENAEISASGTIEGDSSHQTLDEYTAANDPQARPTNPSAPTEDANGNGVLDDGEDANGNGELDTYDHYDGYDGISDRFEKGESMEMPYLGDLQVYREIALHKGGTLSQGGAVVVDAVLGDDAGEDDNLLLVGTEADPIVIDGPIVVETDVVLKGYITGRGTIYAGRNVHVIGNLQYVNPPTWPKPMTDAAAVKEANKSADLVGFAAKGSILIGNYADADWQAKTKKYQSPSFTVEYQVHETDMVNGYVTHQVDGKPYFDGDYTAFDGGQKDDGAGGTEARRFFESSFSDDEINANADADAVTHLDAIFYTNHLFSGSVGQLDINGTIVSRDEAILFSSAIRFNYDNRVRGRGYEYLDIFLPRSPSHHVVYWNQGKPPPPAEKVVE